MHLTHSVSNQRVKGKREGILFSLREDNNQPKGSKYRLIYTLQLSKVEVGQLYQKKVEVGQYLNGKEFL